MDTCGNYEYAKCWLCKGTIVETPTVITVECDEPNGEACPEKDVTVHFGCYMDIEP